MNKECAVCKESSANIQDKWDHDQYSVECPRCGKYNIDGLEYRHLFSTELSPRQRANISGWLRENPGHQISSSNIEQLLSIRTPSFHERADKLLLAFEKKTTFAGEPLEWNTSWMSLGWCLNSQELHEIIYFLAFKERISVDFDKVIAPAVIRPEGWAHLEELKKTNPNSNQCFVAMWFANEMDQIYKNYIKPAIEFIEPEEKEPRYRAVKIDNIEHTNDINDEIIAQIRRSRFMVCDLTGYRGGVYYEAGFAYGLGLKVIYTCRKDWTKEEILKDAMGNEVNTLFDNNHKPVSIKKEGVHFDLDHRVRIEWEATPEGLDKFKTDLENRIKAVIV